MNVAVYWSEKFATDLVLSYHDIAARDTARANAY